MMEPTPESIEKTEKEIKKEVKKLKTVLSDVPPGKMKAAEGLVNRAAYMLVTLMQYERDLIDNGHTELFTQSEKTDPYERERPVARLYNSLIKNYQSCMKQLFDLIPDKPADQESDDPTYNKFFSGKGR